MEFTVHAHSDSWFSAPFGHPVVLARDVRAAGCVVKLSLRFRGKSRLWSPIRDLEEPSLWIGGQLRNQIQSYLACSPVHYPKHAAIPCLKHTAMSCLELNTSSRLLVLLDHLESSCESWHLLLSSTHQLKCSSTGNSRQGTLWLPVTETLASPCQCWR